MHQNDIHTGIEFARAVAAHFKLPAATSAEMQIRCVPNGILAVSVSIPLAADDLAGIAARMNAKTCTDVDAKLSAFLSDENKDGAAYGCAATSK